MYPVLAVPLVTWTSEDLDRVSLGILKVLRINILRKGYIHFSVESFNLLDSVNSLFISLASMFLD